MKRAIVQAIVVCVVLAVTVRVADANYFANNHPVDLVINATNTQPWTSGEWVYMGSANIVNGAGVWDGTIIVESTGVVTSDRIWVGSGSPTTSGRLIVDGGTWTSGSVLHLASRGPDGLGPNEVNLAEIKNGGTLSINGLEISEHAGAFGRLIVDDATLINVGAGRLGTGGATGVGDAEVTIRNGGSGSSGFTAMENGSGHSALNVDGAGSLWTGHSFYMGGNARSAELNVTGGGTVLADNFYCARGAELCEVTVSGAGSTLVPGYSVFIGEVGPARVTVDEGGVFSHTNIGGTGLDVSNTGTLIFGLGNGSRINTTGSAVIDDGATIAAKLDSGFTPTAGVPYDLVTASNAVTANPTNLVLDLDALDVTSAAAGFLALNPGGTALQLTLTSTGQEPASLTRVDNVNVTFFDFDSAAGFENSLESSTNMTDWVFTGLIVTGDGGTLSVYDPTGTDTNKSYRLSITGTGP